MNRLILLSLFVSFWLYPLTADCQNRKPKRKITTKSKPIWIAGKYIGLRLGKSTVKDVRRLFGKPKYIIHPEDEYDNPVESRLDYIYENQPQIIIDKKTGTVIEIWGGDFSTFNEAVEKYGNGFYEVEFTKKGCVFKEYKEKPNRQYPLSIAYPQHGFYFHLDAGKQVLATYHVNKCE